MSDCKQYENITRADLGKLRRRLAKEGIEVPDGDEVEFKALFGVHLSIKFDENQKILEVCITKKPVFVTNNQIWKFIDAGAKQYSDD